MWTSKTNLIFPLLWLSTLFRHPLRLKRVCCVCKWRLSWVQLRTLTKNMMERALESTNGNLARWKRVFRISFLWSLDRLQVFPSQPASPGPKSEAKPEKQKSTYCNGRCCCFFTTLSCFIEVLCSFSCACFSSSRPSEDFLHFANGHRGKLFESSCHKF